MPAQVSEAFVLRTYPYQEADLIVSFFTRDLGKLRGVAKRARRPKGRFGSGLERLSQVRMFYIQRENRELALLSSCELIQSQFTLCQDYGAGVAADYIAEVADHLLPPQEPSERFFRLIAAVLDFLRASPSDHLWPAVNYFTYWAVRLSGFLPELRVSQPSQALAEEMSVKPVAQLAPRAWTRQTAADLRRSLVQRIEEHIERRLVTAPLLETL
jgi:DNA repair protein RecO (recombination protein O)